VGYARDYANIADNKIEEAKHWNNEARVRMSQQQRLEPKVKKYTKVFHEGHKG
jgi:hypothetical protein